jgi:uncharacterized membrane protein (DUF373 family)
MNEKCRIGSDFEHNILESHDPLIRRLLRVIRLAVQALAVLMTFVIVWGILDVLLMLYQKLTSPPYFLLSISDILATFGAFMAVLIAVEIFVNIAMYLERDIIHIKLVVATALMAAARKVIVMDFKVVQPSYVYGLAAVILALGVTFWLLRDSMKLSQGGRGPHSSHDPME